MSGKDDGGHDCAPTTLMFRNVPRRHRNTTLLWEIEFVVGQGSVDMVFLPWESHDRNMGYAFVNFVTAELAERALLAMTGRVWRYSSVPKPIKALVAQVQGLSANLIRLQDMMQRVSGRPVHPLVVLRNRAVDFHDALRAALAGELEGQCVHDCHQPQRRQQQHHQQQQPQELEQDAEQLNKHCHQQRPALQLRLQEHLQQQCHEQSQARAPIVSLQAQLDAQCNEQVYAHPRLMQMQASPLERRQTPRQEVEQHQLSVDPPPRRERHREAQRESTQYSGRSSPACLSDSKGAGGQIGRREAAACGEALIAAESICWLGGNAPHAPAADFSGGGVAIAGGALAQHARADALRTSAYRRSRGEVRAKLERLMGRLHIAPAGQR